MTRYILEWLGPNDDRVQCMEADDFTPELERQMWNLPEGTWVRVTQESRSVLHEGRKLNWKRG